MSGQQQQQPPPPLPLVAAAPPPVPGIPSAAVANPGPAPPAAALLLHPPPPPPPATAAPPPPPATAGSGPAATGSGGTGAALGLSAGSSGGGTSAPAPFPHGDPALNEQEKELKRRLKRLYPAVDEQETPLPRSWSPKDKFSYIGLSQNNLRVHYKGEGWPGPPRPLSCPGRPRGPSRGRRLLAGEPRARPLRRAVGTGVTITGNNTRSSPSFFSFAGF